MPLVNESKELISCIDLYFLYSMIYHQGLLLIICAVLLVPAHSEAVINGYPITFNLAGGTTFMPDAGGVTQSGYTINLGFTGCSWIAAELITPAGNTDVLVVTIDDFYSTSTDGSVSGHQVSYKDYFRNASGLQLDTITLYDVSSYSYKNTMIYSLPITRTLNSNNNEDWPASQKKYSVLKVCFYTSDSTF